MRDEQFFECMESLKNGDRDSLKNIYEEYMPYLYSVIFQKVKNRQDAEDIVSELFIKLWRLASGYEPKNGHRAWLTVIAKNMAIDFIRKNKREELTDFSEENQTDEIVKSNHGIRQLNREAIKKRTPEDEVLGDTSFSEVLLLLKEKERTVIYMKLCGELTFQEISTILKEPIGTITWRYNAAIKKLRRCGYYE